MIPPVITTSAAIDPKVISFLIALVAVGLFLSVLQKIDTKAAWAFVAIVGFGIIIKNPLVLGFLSIEGGL